MARVTTLDLDTPSGPARAHLRPAPDAPRGTLVLGHGAGGSVTAPDLLAATDAANDLGVSVVLVEQPYRVAGRRFPPRAPKLDEAWIAIVGQLDVAGPLVLGGRSSGARVACRTAGELGAAGVLCLAFPLIPPGDRPSRLPELEAVQVPVLVVQGENDRFGMPPRTPEREVVVLAGDHGLKKDLPGVYDAVRRWLPAVLG